MEDLPTKSGQKRCAKMMALNLSVLPIHPFSDGNGRTGRLAMNYFLLQHNHPPIVIHEEDKNLYYQSLEAFDTQEELAPFKLFLKEALVKTWDHPRFLRHVYRR